MQGHERAEGFLPSSLIKRFDHVGLAVRSTDEALRLYIDILGGKLVLHRATGTTNDYSYTQFELGGQRIELIEPIGGVESFLTRFLDAKGEGLHHLTFQVSSIVETTKYLKEKEVRIVDEFYEDPLWKTAFVSPRSSRGVLIQLYETEPGSPFDH